MTIQQHASFDSSAAELNATSKLVKAWESKNAKNAAKAGGISMMALSLAACGGSSTTTTTATDTTTTETTTPVTTPASVSLSLDAATAGDDLVGGAGDDTFTAASSARFQSADVLTGGAGTDTLTAKISGTITPSLEEIEVLNLDTTAAASIDGASISSDATTVNVSGGNTLTYLSHDAEVFTVSEAGTGLTVTDTGTDAATDSISVTLNAGKLGTITVGDKQTTDYETVNVIIGGDGSATLVEADSGTNSESFADAGDKIVVTGSGDYTLNIAGALLGEHATSATDGTIDASGHTGVLTVDVTLAAAVISAKKWDGVDVIKLGVETNADILDNVASGTEVIIDGESAAGDKLTVKTDSTASNDTLKVTLNEAVAGVGIDVTTLTTDGFETLTINSTGTDTAAAVVKNVVDNIAGLTTDPNLILTGDKHLTSTGVEATFTNIDVTNTAGVDITVASGGALNFLGGSGNDRLELDTVADLTATDVIDGGDGTDTLAFSQIPAAVSAAQLGYISNIEVIEFEASNTLTAAVSLDVSTEAGLNTVKFNGDLVVDDGATNTYNLTVKGVDGLTVETGVVTNTGTGNSPVMAFILDVKDASNAGTNNTVNYNLMDAGTGDIVNAGFQIDNVENLNINMLGDGDADDEDTTTITLIDGAQLTSLTVTSVNTGVDAAGVLDGSDDLIITAVETTLLGTLDASALTGDLDFTDQSAFISTGATIKGGSAVDTIDAGAGADSIFGNKGADVLDGKAGNDAIDGGAGNDGITGGAGADTLTGGTGLNTFVFADGASTEAAMDIIKDFVAGPADGDYDTLDVVGATVSKNESSAVDVKAATTATDVITATVANGIITLGGADKANVDTVAEFINVAEILLARNIVDDSDAEAGVIAFELGGSTYVVAGDDGDTEATYATEVVVMLEGVTDITGISTTHALDTIHIT